MDSSIFLQLIHMKVPLSSNSITMLHDSINFKQSIFLVLMTICDSNALLATRYNLQVTEI